MGNSNRCGLDVVVVARAAADRSGGAGRMRVVWYRSFGMAFELAQALFHGPGRLRLIWPWLLTQTGAQMSFAAVGWIVFAAQFSVSPWRRGLAIVMGLSVMASWAGLATGIAAVPSNLFWVPALSVIGLPGLLLAWRPINGLFGVYSPMVCFGMSSHSLLTRFRLWTVWC